MAWSKETLNVAKASILYNMVRNKKLKMKKSVMVQKKPPQVVRGTREEINAFRNREFDKYRKKLRGYDGFDLCGRKAPVSLAEPELRAHKCDDRKKRCCDLVLRYAKFGLHRYNLLEGKNLRLSSVKRYNMNDGSYVSLFCDYYITLEANDPANDPATLQTFEVKVGARRQSNTLLVLECFVARLRGEITKSTTNSGFRYKYLFRPELPPENPFKDDSSQFYVLKESELDDNDHWIRLYLELTVSATSWSFIKHALTNLKILKVSMESTPYLTQGFGAHDATFYIRYEDSCKARAGKYADRVATVRRVFDEKTKGFGLVGRQDSSHIVIPSNMEPASSPAPTTD